MPVQTKSRNGEKTPKKERNWTQICVIGFCVLLVVMCVVSFSGLPRAFGNLINGGGTTTPSTSAVVAGNPVYVNYTLNINGSPVFENALGFYAGSETNESMYVNVTGYSYPFVIYASEINQISSGVIGLSVGESRTVAGSGSDLAYTLTKEGAETAGLVFNETEINDRVFLTTTYTDELGEEEQAYRIGVVTAKTDDGLTIQYGSDTIDIEMVGYLTTS